MKALLRQAGWPGVVSTAVAVIVALAMIRALMPLSSHMPGWDQWYMTPVFEAHHEGRPVLPLLLAHYNGHYNWLSRSLFYGLGLLTRWNLKVEVALGFAWAACTLAVLLRMLWEASPRLLVLAAPCAALVFSSLQYSNFLNGFGMGQLMGTFFVVLTLYLLTDPQAGPRRFALAMACAMAAFLSHGATLVLVPAGTGAVLFIGPRRSWPRIALWSLMAAIGIGFAAVGGRSIRLAVEWSRLPAFALTLLGRPFTLEMGPGTHGTMVLGATLLVAFVFVVALRLAREWHTRRDVLVRWTCLGLTAAVAALLIATSKSRAPLEWALSGHYTTSTYLLGPALLFLVADGLRDGRSRAAGPWRALLALALAVVCAAPLVQQAVASSSVVPILRSWKLLNVQMSRRVAVGTATDPEILMAMNNDAEDVRRSVAFLRARRLAWFAHAREARQPFGALDSVTGRMPASSVVLGAGEPWTFEGWALPPLTALATPVEVVLEIDGAAVAETRPSRHRPDRGAYFGSPAFASCGFVLVAPDGARTPPGRYAVRILLRTPHRTTTLRRLDLVVR